MLLLPNDHTSGTSPGMPTPQDQLNPPLLTLNGKQRYWAEKSPEQDLEDIDRIDEDTFNRILWHAVKGYDLAYPGLSNRKK